MPPPPAYHEDPVKTDPQVEFETAVDIEGLDRKLTGSSRMQFVKKVYGILFAQLAVTALWIGIVASDRVFFYNFLRNRVELLVLAIIGYMVTLYALACYKPVARKVPLNYYLLATFTMCFAYIASYTTVLYEPELIVAAGTLTAAMVLGLTIYAVTTKTDFSMLFAFLWSLVVTLLFAVILALFIRNRVLQIFLSVLIIMILSIYIIYDTQLIIGERSAELSIDDYVFAAMIWLCSLQTFMSVCY